MLKVQNLTKVYQGNKKAVDNISFEVKNGEIFGFLGPNGAGKTTTIKMITGILKKDTGVISLNGVDTDTDPLKVKKMISYVPDNPDINKRLTGVEYLNFISDIYEISPADRVGRIEKYAALFELTSALPNSITSYSHGMQQKLVLIGAMISEPQIIILDEPMVGLDPKSAFNLKEEMRKMTQTGKSVFFSTHVLDVAEKFCDRVGIIDKGRLIACGSLEELRNSEHASGATLEEIFLQLTND